MMVGGAVFDALTIQKSPQSWGDINIVSLWRFEAWGRQRLPLLLQIQV